jgi:hypothetical protein
VLKDVEVKVIVAEILHTGVPVFRNLVIHHF